MLKQHCPKPESYTTILSLKDCNPSRAQHLEDCEFERSVFERPSPAAWVVPRESRSSESDQRISIGRFNPATSTPTRSSHSETNKHACVNVFWSLDGEHE
jgi:hypothetical protein